MKLFRKFLSGMLSAAVAAGALSALPMTTASAADAVTLAESMGMGWNLGNTFDSANCAGYNTVDGWVNTETGWGNPKTTKAMIDTIKSYGFQSIRLPVTWYENMDSSYTINEQYLARVKEVVDYCVEDGLYVMLNMHHDGASTSGGNATANATTGNYDKDGIWKGVEKKDKFTSAWTQIANYFKSYDEHLVFEGWNEICWTYDVELTMAQAFVDTVRATGGNNASRLLVIPANNTDLTAALNDSFQLPKDSANMLGVDIHFYYPSQFAVAEQGASWGYTSTWGTDSDISTMKNDVNKAYQKFAAKGIPVFWGEASVLTDQGKDQASIRSWIQTLYSTSLGYDGVVPMLWDDSNSGHHCYFDRIKLEWFDSEIGTIFKNMTGTSTDTVSFVRLSGDDITAGEDGNGNPTWTVNIKPYRDIAKITGVVIEGSATGTGSDPCFGISLACNGYFTEVDEGDNYTWMWAPQISYGATQASATITFDEEGMNDGAYLKEGTDWHLCYDFIMLSSYWTNNAKDLKIESVTLTFAEPVVLDQQPDDTTVTTTTTTTTTETTTTTTETETTTTVTETSTTTTETETSVTTPSDEVKGDLNGDGTLDVKDAVLLARYVGNEEVDIDDAGKARADIDGTEGLTTDDLTLMLRVIAKIVTL